MAKYHIPKGQHYNSSKIRFIISLVFGVINAEVIRRWFLIHLSSLMVRYTYFPRNAWYSKMALQKDAQGNPLTGWNKLFGFSGFLIHLFSARLVWQPVFDRPGWIRIALYVYNKGVWDAVEIAQVQVHTINKMSVRAATDGYYGWVNNNFRFLEAEKTPHFIKAEPYFGGQSTSPEDIDIYLYNPLTYSLFKELIHQYHGI